MTNTRAILYGTIAFVVAVLDGAFKIAAHSLPPDTAELSWPIALALHKNYGIIANLPLPLSVVIPITIVTCSILGILVWQKRHTATNLSLACCVILFGALGNLLDRIINGYTTDYIILLQRSAVNLADALILIGVVLFACYSKESSPGV